MGTVRLDTVCYRCDRSYSASGRTRCECGEPVWLATAVSPHDWSQNDQRETGVWRYRSLLPVDGPIGVGSGAGGTPLIRAERLDEFAGARVSVKDEGENPTGSYKDRGSAVGIPAVIEQEGEWVGTVSYGNMAMSTAASAAGTDLGCFVLVPDDISRTRQVLIGQYEPTVYRIDGDYSQLYYDTLRIGDELGIAFLNGDHPLRLAGYKTLAFEIVEQCAGSLPDAIVLPASSGGHASGVWKGLRELVAMDVIDTPPRIFLVQTEAFDPIARAYDAGDESVSPIVGGTTIAYSISNPDPPSGTRALTAARETNGGVVAVSDAEIEDAQRRLAAHAGVCAEPASATPLAGTRRLVERGELTATDDVVLVVTGTGFKELTVSGVPEELPQLPLSELETRLDQAMNSGP